VVSDRQQVHRRRPPTDLDHEARRRRRFFRRSSSKGSSKGSGAALASAPDLKCSDRRVVFHATDAGALVVPAEFMIRQALMVLGFGAGTGLLGSAFGMWGFLRD
jgi:hypothetical protein